MISKEVRGIMKIVFSVLVSISLLAGIYTNNQEDNLKINDMTEMKEIVDENNIVITSWKVYQRKELGTANSSEEMMKKITKFKTTYEDYNWELTLAKENHHYVWNGRKRENSSGMTEGMKLTSYVSGGKYEIGLTYEVKGTELNQNHLAWIEKTFNEEENIFYTIAGNLESTDIVTLSNEILTSANGEVVEQLNENSFVSISAYSNVFESQLITKNDHPFNMQVGLRVNGETSKIDVTIGTPIITSEY